MPLTWINWCSLCATESDSKINLFVKDENGTLLADKINNYFSILISPNDGLPQFICNKCFRYLEGVDKFAERCSRAHTMFLDLKECVSSRDAQKIRRQHGFIKGEPESTDDISDSNDKDVDMDYDDNDFEEEEIELNPGIESSLLKVEITLDETQDQLQLNDQTNSDITEKATRTCAHCDKCFKSDLPYRKHLKYVHDIKVEREAFDCRICPEMFGDGKSLRNHIDSKHLVEDPMSSHCTVCDKKFTTPSSLRTHLKVVHLDERPFVCEECGKAFSTIYKLREHKTIHSDERKFTCDVCQKSFKNKTRLRVHQDIHSSTVYFCPVCGLKLNTIKTLNSHKLVHSDVKNFKCTICDSAFKRQKNYKQHLKFKHSSHTATGEAIKKNASAD